MPDSRIPCVMGTNESTITESLMKPTDIETRSPGSALAFSGGSSSRGFIVRAPEANAVIKGVHAMQAVRTFKNLHMQ